MKPTYVNIRGRIQFSGSLYNMAVQPKNRDYTTGRVDNIPVLDAYPNRR
jgi:hypothetical protein